jgi:hypothetical protein
MQRTRLAMLKQMVFICIYLTFGATASSQVPSGFTVFAILHPSWYLNVFATDQSEKERLLFRRFAYEGNLRNIFVLSCPKDRTRSISVEIYPPSALKDALRKNAKAKLQSTTIVIESEGGAKLVSEGEYDKVAAFLDLPSEDDFYKFLELTGFINQPSYISLQMAHIKFGLSNEDSLEEIFNSKFDSYFENERVRKLSWQDVFVRCSELRD